VAEKASETLAQSGFSGLHGQSKGQKSKGKQPRSELPPLGGWKQKCAPRSWPTDRRIAFRWNSAALSILAGKARGTRFAMRGKEVPLGVLTRFARGSQL